MLTETAAELRRGAGWVAELECADAWLEGRRSAEERAVTAAFGLEFIDVDLRDEERELEAETFGFSEDDTILGDEAMAAVDDVGARFAGARRGVDVGGEAAGRLGAHEVSAVGGLGQEFVAGRKVAEKGSAREGLGAARGFDGPEVFAELDADHAVREVGGLEKEVSAEGDGLAEEVDFFDGSDAGGGEPALFIELTRVRQVGFGDDAEDLAARDEGSGVKETSRDL
jgi:hypothetical protein